MHRIALTVVAAAWLMTAISGCKEEKPASEHKPRDKPVFRLTEAGAPTPTPAAGETQPALPPGHPPIGPTSPDAGLPPGHPPVEGGASGNTPTLAFKPDVEWIPQPPRPMTQAVFKLPKAEGDPEDADLAVSSLSKAVPMASNVNRWCGQFELPEGKTCDDFSQPVTIEGTAYPTLLIEIHGSYKGSSMMGPAGPAKAGYRMLAAEISTPTGPWYVKLVGPEKTVERWRDSFMTFVREAR